MFRTALALVALTVLPAASSAQTDTTRRDSIRTSQDSTRRARTESRGEIDLARSAARFDVGMPNFGFSSTQAVELQQALTRAGCDVGIADGVVGNRTVLGIKCFRDQKNLSEVGIEQVLTALGVSFARPAEPLPAPAEPAPPKRDSIVLPPVIRQDSTYRPDVRARRDSAMRDSVRRDSLRRDSTARRDTTRRP
jgi:peptidoglycan hydrolase-like protein with peptidoglycan-binding domain